MSATYNRIGGTGPGERNLVSGNGGGGISIQSPDTLVRGNDIGIDITGRRALGNGGGVGLGGGRSILGGTTPPEANVIGGSGWFGVGVGSDYNTIAGNYIGTDAGGQVAMGNMAGGVAITSAVNTIIQGNVIANTSKTLQNQAGDGIAVRPLSNTTIRRNSIHSNAGQGVSAAMPAPPVISSVGTTSVSGTACPGCEVEIFSDVEDEGRVFEGETIADASGRFTLTLQRLVTGPNVTATATDLQGNTSAFSAAHAAPPRPPRRRAVRS